MSYIHVPTLRYPLSPNKIREENPNTSFSRPFVPTDDYVSVASSEQPAHDPMTHKLQELQPVLLDGIWMQQWEIVALTQEEIDILNALEASKAEAHAEKIKNLRAEAYRAESDPIFFKAQRGEATLQQWLDKVAEIKARPYHVDQQA